MCDLAVAVSLFRQYEETPEKFKDIDPEDLYQMVATGMLKLDEEIEDEL